MKWIIPILLFLLFACTKDPVCRCDIYFDVICTNGVIDSVYYKSFYTTEPELYDGKIEDVIITNKKIAIAKTYCYE